MTKDFCKNVITIPQINGTCWFNCLIMMLFYSQHSRKLLLYHNPFNGKTDILSKTLNSILYKNYKLNDKTINFFSTNSIDSILTKFKLNSDVYNFISTKGYFIQFFIQNIFTALDLNYLTIDFFNTYKRNPLYGTFTDKIFYFSITETISHYIDKYNNRIYISILNDYYSRQIYKEYIKKKIEETIPLYLIINLWDNIGYTNHYFGNNTTNILNDFYILNNSFNFNISGHNELSNEITFNDRIYILDSITIGNYNANDINLGHAVAGITCKNNKYVYNGWVRNTYDPSIKNEINRLLPCELMSYNWNIHKNDEFCINANNCSLPNNLDYNDLCFSFNKGIRTLFYVLKDSNYKSLDYNKSSSNSYRKQEENKHKEDKQKEDKIKAKEIKPKPKEIKPKEIKQKEIKPKPKEDKIKKCPSDKILNPRTKRCVLKRGKIGKLLLKK